MGLKTRDLSSEAGTVMVLVAAMSALLILIAAVAIDAGRLYVVQTKAQAAADAGAGQTGWLTIGGVASALLLGATVLMATIAFGVERFFVYTT